MCDYFIIILLLFWGGGILDQLGARGCAPQRRRNKATGDEGCGAGAALPWVVLVPPQREVVSELADPAVVGAEDLNQTPVRTASLTGPNARTKKLQPARCKAKTGTDADQTKDGKGGEEKDGWEWGWGEEGGEGAGWGDGWE